MDDVDMEASTSQTNWELTNNVELMDNIYTYDKKKHSEILKAKPWTKNHNYFTNVRVSALALLKMVMHAKSGGNIEIMGLLLGKVDGRSMIVIDTFALPVEGTETRVNAQSEAYEYMAEYTELVKRAGRLECVIGWYHSHPGYGCWLSGIDVNTQMLNQQFQEPFVAIVVDPIRTMSAGKVDIGAFRTYPKDCAPDSASPSEYQSIPLDKIKDFGVHCKQYYSLDISYFKSSLDKKMLDILWSEYWINTLSSNNLLNNSTFIMRQLDDIGNKIKQTNKNEHDSSNKGHPLMKSDKKKKNRRKTKIDNLNFEKNTRDMCKSTSELLRSKMIQVMKEQLFNGHLEYGGGVVYGQEEAWLQD